MKGHPSSRLAALRSRIRSLVAEGGPVRARAAYATLRADAEQWTRSEIDRAKRGEVRVIGNTKGATWAALSPAYCEGQRLARIAGRAVVLKPAAKPEKRKPSKRLASFRGGAGGRRPAPTMKKMAHPLAVATPPPRRPLRCESCGQQIGSRGEGEAIRCYRPACREAA